MIGVPGDEVAYLNKKLTINGKPVETTALDEFYDDETMRYFLQYSEKWATIRTVCWWIKIVLYPATVCGRVCLQGKLPL